MMRRSVLVLLMLGLVAMTPGCLKMKMHFHILPDGSGKVVQTFGNMPYEQVKKILVDKMQIPEEMFTEEQFEENKEEGDDPFADLKNMQGIVWDEPTESVGEDGWTYTTVVGYFADFNAIRSADEDTDSPLNGVRFEATEAGHKLTFPGDEDGGEEKPADETPSDPAMEAMMMDLLSSMELRVEFEMPGAITECDEILQGEHVIVGKRSERSAGILFTGQMLEPGTEPNLEVTEDFVVTSGAPVDQAALAAEVKEALARHAGE